jgi:hypothetical protein
MSKTKITKSVERCIQTKQFEQVTITVGREEEIEWKDDVDKNKKIDKFTQDILSDFTITYNEVCNKLGVNRCIGVVSTTKPVDEKTSSFPAKNEPKKETEKDSSQFNF